MTYRVLALTVAAGLISSAALAKPHCPLGKIYYRSKHACLAKEVAIDRGIYHYRHHIAAEAAGTTIVRRSARVHLAAPAAIPVPPVRLVRIGTASLPTRNENDKSIGPIEPPAPETRRPSISPYGALVRVTPID